MNDHNKWVSIIIHEKNHLSVLNLTVHNLNHTTLLI